MRYIFTGLYIIVTLILSTTLKGQDINASMTAKQYAYKDSLTLVDLYFKISANQLVVRESKGEEFVDIELMLDLKEKESHITKFGDRFKISLNINEMTDAYIYYKQSFVTQAGDYNFHIEMKDANTTYLPIINDFEYQIEDKMALKVSDIFCFEKAIPASKDHAFYKSGFAIYPKFQSGEYLYNMNDTVLNYYMEFYNVTSDKPLYIERYIKGKALNMAIKSTYSVKGFNASKRKIESNSISLDELSSGNYELVISIFDEEKKQLLKNSIPFQKISSPKEQKKIVNKKNYIRSLYKKTLFEKHGLNDVHRLNQFIAVMALGEEKTGRRIFYNAIDNTNIEEKENFFLNYWETKDRLHPQFAVEQFANTFNAVQDKFSYRDQDGYKTDKGRVYLEYGKPDDVQQKSKDHDSKPYEIWHYYKLKSGQGNVIFVFHDRSSSGNYELFHSNAVGELENPNWQSIIQSINGSLIGN